MNADLISSLPSDLQNFGVLKYLDDYSKARLACASHALKTFSPNHGAVFLEQMTDLNKMVWDYEESLLALVQAGETSIIKTMDFICNMDVKFELMERLCVYDLELYDASRVLRCFEGMCDHADSLIHYQPHMAQEAVCFEYLNKVLERRQRNILRALKKVVEAL